MTILIAFTLSAVMVVYRTGKSWQWDAEAEQLNHLKEDIDVEKTYSEIEGD